MVTLKFYLDSRAVKTGNEAPVRVAIHRNSVRSFINTGVKVKPEQWDKVLQRVKRRPDAMVLNARLRDIMQRIETVTQDLYLSGRLKGLTATEVKNMIDRYMDPESEGVDAGLLCSALNISVESHHGRTRELYEATVSRLRDWLGDDYERVKLEDVNRVWLDKFDVFLQKRSKSKNGRNIHFRNIRAAFNRAIDDGVTTWYPFRGYKLRGEPTRKRSLPIDTLRGIAKVKVDSWAEPYRDMFLLSFLLCGINVVDLCSLDKLHSGRIEYRRAKTGRLYSIKVEPEAMTLIDRWRGKKQLLYMLDGHKDYRIWYNQMRRGLRHLTERLRGAGYDVDSLTSYWARHSWATVAAWLDVPKETIAAGLGHGGNSVTDIYIDFDERKVDMANRKVIDWVFYGKK